MTAMQAGGRGFDAHSLLVLGTATLAESGGVALSPRIRPIWPGAAFAGPAFTVACEPGDNLAIHAGVARAPRGSVLAVAVGGDRECGYWGEVLSTAAEAAGVIALVIDGTVRDAAAIERHRFPVFARGLALPGATKLGPGATGGPIVLGGTAVDAGDWLVGDLDGVVSLKAGTVVECLKAAQERASREQEMFRRLRSGSTTVELLALNVSGVERR